MAVLAAFAACLGSFFTVIGEIARVLVAALAPLLIAGAAVVFSGHGVQTSYDFGMHGKLPYTDSEFGDIGRFALLREVRTGGIK